MVVTVLGAVYLVTTFVTVMVTLKRACMNKDVKEPIQPPDAVAASLPAIYGCCQLHYAAG